MSASFDRVSELTEPIAFTEPAAEPVDPGFVVDPDANFIAEGVANYEAREFDRAAADFTAEIDARPLLGS